jgi:hypothetical protein
MDVRMPNQKLGTQAKPAANDRRTLDLHSKKENFRDFSSPTSLFFPLGVHVSNFKELSHGISLQLCISRQNLNSICFVDRVHYYY